MAFREATRLQPIAPQAPGEGQGGLDLSGGDRPGERRSDVRVVRGETIEPRTTAFAIPYSAEYIPRTQNLRLLRKLADLTGGRVLHVTDGSETLAELFQVSGDGHRPPYNLWYALILSAHALFLRYRRA